MLTMSTRLLSISRRQSSNTSNPGDFSAAAKLSALLRVRFQSAVTLTPGRREKALAWQRPARPVPMIPTRRDSATDA